MAPEFVHLHVHSEFSMLDGAIRIPQLVEHVDKMGMSAVALTDNGNMFGAVQLVRTCERSQVKAILVLPRGLQLDEVEPQLLEQIVLGL